MSIPFWDLCFYIILERRLLFCIPETPAPVITPITRTLHFLLWVLLNWFWRLPDSLRCNEGKIVTTILAIKHNNFWALSGIDHFEISATEADVFKSTSAAWKLENRTARLNFTKPLPFGIMERAASRKLSAALHILVTWVQTYDWLTDDLVLAMCSWNGRMIYLHLTNT